MYYDDLWLDGAAAGSPPMQQSHHHHHLPHPNHPNHPQPSYYYNYDKEEAAIRAKRYHVPFAHRLSDEYFGPPQRPHPRDSYMDPRRNGVARVQSFSHHRVFVPTSSGGPRRPTTRLQRHWSQGQRDMVHFYPTLPPRSGLVQATPSFAHRFHSCERRKAQPRGQFKMVPKQSKGKIPSNTSQPSLGRECNNINFQAGSSATLPKLARLAKADSSSKRVQKSSSFHVVNNSSSSFLTSKLQDQSMGIHRLIFDRMAASNGSLCCPQCGASPDVNENFSSVKKCQHGQKMNPVRLLNSEEQLKILKFRRFLSSASVNTKADFLKRVSAMRRRLLRSARKSIVDEHGISDHPGSKFRQQRAEDEAEFREFLETVAVVLCSDIEISSDTFHRAARGYGVPERLYQLVDRSTDGLVTADQVMEFIAGLQAISPRSEMTEENLKWLENVFRRTVGENGEIRLQDFKNIVHSKNPFFVERVFHIFDKDDNGSISLQEFIDAMHQFAGQSPDDKIKFLFKVYDIDGDGLIQEKELQHVMRACMDENGMRFDEGEVDELTRALFHDATVVTSSAKNNAGITFDALKAQLTKHDGLLQNLSISIDRWLVPPKPKKPNTLWEAAMAKIPHQFSVPYMRNNMEFIGFTILFILLNVGLFVARCYEYRNFKNYDYTRNWWIIMARACGQGLNFTSMFILVLMLRHGITKLREMGLAVLLPLDRHIYFHKITGRLIVVYSLVHTGAHLGNLFKNALETPVAFLLANGIEPNVHVLSQNLTALDWLLTDKPHYFGLVPGWANPTGVVLLAVLVVMFVCSMKWVRKGGYFEVFYWSHLLYVFYWVLLILHAPNFWKWFIVPCILFIVEKVFRFAKSLSDEGKAWVTMGVVLPSRVVSLVIRRPPHFTFKPGDYIFINIPAIATFEWHPFTISSAPEQSDVISLHIRVVGHWTNKLYEYFEAEQKRLQCTLQGGVCAEPETKLEKVQKTIVAAKERARKTSMTILGTATGPSRRESRQENNNSGIVNLAADLDAEYVPSGVSEVEKNLRARMRKREGLMRQRESELAKLEETDGDSTSPGPEAKMIARTFRYMRRKPTIISYKPPEAAIAEEQELSDVVVLGDQPSGSSEMILERLSRESSDHHHKIETELSAIVVATEAEAEKVTKKDLELIQVADSAESDDNMRLTKPLVVYIDGPFGAPTSQIFRAQHAVLIGTGIGVTPFASILQSIMHRYWQARNTCPKCQYKWTNDLSASVGLNLRKVDFFWINRDQRSFEWFVNLLSQLEIEQAEQGGAMERFLDMHMYITSALQKTDMKAVGLQLALDLLHKKSKRDLITGLKTRTNAGRPNWDKVFKELQTQKKGKITVFFCGSPQLGKILKLKCDEFGFDYRKENF